MYILVMSTTSAINMALSLLQHETAIFAVTLAEGMVEMKRE